MGEKSLGKGVDEMLGFVFPFSGVNFTHQLEHVTVDLHRHAVSLCRECSD